MNALPAETVRLITSSQVITSVFSIVKELVENSLDANATSIEVKLENCGFDKIEIRDDGSGIPLDNVPYMAQRHFTSKITQMSDLHQLLTYGFRGEALASLCAVASVTIATKTNEDPISMVYTLDDKGKVTASKPCHLGKGTTVTASNLFKNTPVRKQFFSSTKRRKDELRKVEELIMQFAVIKPHVRFVVRNDKTVVLQKNKVANHKAALGTVWGRNIVSAMNEVSIPAGNAKVDCFLPKPNSNLQLISRSSNDRCWVFINGRPVSYREIEKILKHCVLGCYPTQSSGRYPFAFVTISIPPDAIDVNLEPNKTKVLLQEKDSILEAIETKLQEVYQIEPKKVNENADEDYPSTGHFAQCGSSIPVDDDRMVMQRSEDLTLQQDSWEFMSNNGRMSEKLIRDPPQELSTSQLVCQGTEKHQQDILLTSKNMNLCCDKVVQQESINQEDIPPDTLRLPDRNLLMKVNSIPTSDTEINIDAQNPVCNITINPGAVGALDSNERSNALDTGIDTGTISLVSEKTGNVSTDTVNNGKLINHKFASDGTNHIGNSELDLSGELTDSALMDFLETKCDVIDTSLSDSTIEGILESTNKISAVEWSRGKGVKGEPTTILLPTQNNSTIINNKTEDFKMKNCETPSREKKTNQERISQATFYNLVGRTPIKRPQTAYIFFLKEMRPQIIEENPTADFQTISKLISERWKMLSEDDKSKFEDLMRQDVERYKEQVKEAKKNGRMHEPVRKKKCIKQPIPQQVLVDKLFSSPKKAPTTSTPAVKSVDVYFSCPGLKAEQKTKNWEKYEKHSLIGQLSSGFWIWKEGDQLKLLNHYRVEETLLYHRLLAEHNLQTQSLQPPITLSPSMIGGQENWQTLMTLKSSLSAVDGTRTFDDERLVANGFEIKQTEDNVSGDVRIQIVGMATNIACYGLPDLAQILDLIGSSMDGCISLHASRPAKLIHYLKGEAVRLARDLPHRSTKDDIVDMLDRKRAFLPSNIQNCIHNKPFFQKLHTIKSC